MDELTDLVLNRHLLGLGINVFIVVVLICAVYVLRHRYRS